jgi:putative ABC transport system permease protein
VNFLRTSILFLMLYLIYTRDITVGQFFSLWIYSFFIFGPLQELGNIINIYRETEASLNMFEGILQIPKEPRPLNPLPLDDVRTLEAAASRSAAQPRFRTYVLAGFATISLLLAATGLYGLLSYSVTQRVREIGVRMALGARPRDVLRLVVGEGMRLVALGAVAGVLGAVAAGRLVTSLLFGVSTTDPATYAAVIGVLGLVACVACSLPALRAARVNPMSALRSE